MHKDNLIFFLAMEMYGCIPHHILNLCTRWLLYPHRPLPSDTHWMGLAGPQVWFEYCGEEKNLLLLLRIEP
jgi:hypothetical protein